ncbi:hypothetical protein ACFSKL_18615 [Belliella marina]|uniref:DoxX protein n=1 Tax=Belliella marina TaxID=1644146 RepID=A0ABW4VVB5_9BACT
MNEFKSRFWPQLVVVYTRFLLGGGFVFASIIKIKGKRFTTIGHEDASFGTAMHFFETMFQTGIYWQFLGWAQLLAGLLLMTQRFAKLGLALFIPIIVNIYIITISMDFGYTSVITGMMLITGLGLLIWHWEELRILINLPYNETPKHRLENEKLWVGTGGLMFLFTVIYRILYDSYDPIFWFGVCFLIGLAALLIRISMKRYHRLQK